MKTVMMTGATSGIGKEATKLFLEEGYRVLAVGRCPDKLQNLEAEFVALGANLSVKRCEISETNEILKLFEDLEPLDILINNAGIYAQNSWLDSNPDDFDRMFQVNSRSVFFFSQQAVLNMRRHERRGLILNNSSTLGQKPAPQTSLYSASKAAVISLTQSLALDLGPEIRANCILPGIVDTPIHHKAAGVEAARRFQEEIAGLHPLKRTGKASEIAALLLLLAQPSMEWMTGSSITLDGGISLVT